MRQIIIILSSFVSILGINSISAQHVARVTRVKDGDTFILGNGSKSFTARLNNVDAPELKQNAGLNAYLYLNTKIIGKVLDYDSTGKDLYGRTLISAKLDGRRLDSMLIRDGWAWHYVNYSKDSLLDTAMKQAAFSSVGLWACGFSKVCPPWLWRKYNIKNQMRYCKGCKSNF